MLCIVKWVDLNGDPVSSREVDIDLKLGDTVAAVRQRLVLAGIPENCRFRAANGEPLSQAAEDRPYQEVFTADYPDDGRSSLTVTCISDIPAAEPRIRKLAADKAEIEMLTSDTAVLTARKAKLDADRAVEDHAEAAMRRREERGREALDDRQKLLDRLRVTVPDPTAQIATAMAETPLARRDFTAEAATRVFTAGGGTLAAPPIDPPTYRQRRVENADGKARIGARVAELVGDGSAVFLDTGTTCEAVAQALTGRQNLRVVTYSLRSAALLSEVESATVAVPGGFVRHVDAGVFSHETVDFIGAFRFDTAVISVSGIDEHGIMGDDDHGEVQAVRAAMQQAKRTILAVDGSKFFRRGLVSLAVISEVDLVVTDTPPPPAITALLAVAGVGVELAGG